MKTFFAFLGVMTCVIWGPILIVYVIALTLLRVYAEALIVVGRLLLTLCDVATKRLTRWLA